MRYLIDSLIVLMIAGMVGAVVLWHTQDTKTEQQVGLTAQALAVLEKELQVRFSIEEDTDKSLAGYPIFVQPDWFNGKTYPVNHLTDDQHPWIDIAPPSDVKHHPPDPVLADKDQAGFWYNPNTGVFRARVPFQGTERDTLELYNQINGAALHEIPRATELVTRAPIPYHPEWSGVMTASVEPAPLLNTTAESVSEPEGPSFFEQATGRLRPAPARANEPTEHDPHRPSLHTPPSS